MSKKSNRLVFWIPSKLVVKTDKPNFPADVPRNPHSQMGILAVDQFDSLVRRLKNGTRRV